MQTESVAIAALVLDPANARKHERKNLEAIKGSLARFGQQKPIVIDKNNVVRAGNGTLEAARQLGWDKISVYRTALEGTEATAFALADNRSAELAEWDKDILSETLKSLKDLDFDLGAIGFDEDDLAKLAPETKEGLTDDDAIPDKVETRCKSGDLWQLGSHRLLCGDSTNVQHVESLMDGEKGELLLTDPPYGVSYVEKNAAVHGGIVKNAIGKKITNDCLTVEEMGQLWRAIFALAFCFSNTASYYVFPPQGGELMMMMQAIHQSDWQLKHSLIWQKQNFVFGRCDYHYQHEPVLYGWKKKGTHNWYADRSQSSLLQFDKPNRSDLHPTTKPIDILEYLIGNSSKPTDLVVDLFLGSGSTLIACEKTGRRCFGMEIDAHYCDIILKRWEDYTGKTAVLAPGVAP